ncbi:DUF6492 family protein [Algiphilus sp.]|uniref:DUF6492 family protein n=1 Tax=Algiphilus sp. TaxID=1872431 RepID=UPI003BA9F2F2
MGSGEAAAATTDDILLVTPTWAADRAHFALMRHSIEASALGALRHEVIVQSEDVDVFADFARGPVRVRATADLLPAVVEERRVQALRRAQRLGHRGTQWAGSLALRTGGFPQWVGYTGWHVQQISKLAVAAESRCDTVVVVDCDVVVLPHATAAHLRDDQDRILCLHDPCRPDRIGTKAARWNRQAHRLFQQPFDPRRDYDGAFDTPFVFHAPTVRRMLRHLEQRFRQPWWQVLLNQPVRRWSEFATYRAYIKHFLPQDAVRWRQGPGVTTTSIHRAPAAKAIRAALWEMMRNTAGPPFVTVHSVQAGQRRFQPCDYAPWWFEAPARAG